MTHYIAILDFTTCEVHIHPYKDEEEGEEFKSAEDIVTELGYNVDNCEYMCMDNLILQIHP